MSISFRYTEEELKELIRINKGACAKRYKERLDVVQQAKRVRQKNSDAMIFEDILKDRMEDLND